VASVSREPGVVNRWNKAIETIDVVQVQKHLNGERDGRCSYPGYPLLRREDGSGRGVRPFWKVAPANLKW
jgi:hypothetical protein